MKNILVAILISLVIVTLYTFFVLALLPTLMGLTLFEAPSTPQIPISLPNFLFFNFAPDSLQNLFFSIPGGMLLLKLISIFINALLYAIPIYFIFKIIEILRKNKTGEIPK